jgi:hypothetical protein
MTPSADKNVYVPQTEVEFAKYPTAQKLLKRCQDLLAEIDNLQVCSYLDIFSPHANTISGLQAMNLKSTSTKITAQEAPSTRISAL